jgi:alpha-methylacyl-CoA racemase
MGPVQGLRVVEPAAIGPAPFVCMMLADLGADVVRVDRADGARPFAPWHGVLERGRRSSAVDLKSEPVVEALLRLVERSDVLVGGFRPGVAERLGVGPGQCAARNPALVHARMTGWGQDGPLSGAAGHDIDYLALGGALHAIGRAGGPPVPPVDLLGGFAGGGLLLVASVLDALREWQRSGLGQVVDAAIADGTAAMLAMLLFMGLAGAGQWREERGGTLLEGGARFLRRPRLRGWRPGGRGCAAGALLRGAADRAGPGRQGPGRPRRPGAVAGAAGAVRRAFRVPDLRPSAPRGAWHLPPGSRTREVPAGCGPAPEEIDPLTAAG